MIRLLRPGGFLIITAPFCSLTHFAPYYYQTGYSHYFYEYWFDELGLDIIEVQWNGNYFEWIAQELRRLPKTSEQYADTNLSIKEKFAIEILLAGLSRLSSAGQDSKQLLCYGLHVFAEKR